MILTLKPGESVKIEFADSDGDLTVSFGKDRIAVTTDWPDSEGRSGTVYEERFGDQKPVSRFTNRFVTGELTKHPGWRLNPNAKPVIRDGYEFKSYMRLVGIYCRYNEALDAHYEKNYLKSTYSAWIGVTLIGNRFQSETGCLDAIMKVVRNA